MTRAAALAGLLCVLLLAGCAGQSPESTNRVTAPANQTGPATADTGGNSGAIASNPPTNGTTKPPAQNETTPDGLYPRSTRTGIPKLDHVLEAVAIKDAKALGELVEMTKMPCKTSPYGMHGQPLCEGKPEGTPIDVFPAPRCEPANLSTIEQVRAMLPSVISSRQLYVYAAYRSNYKMGDRSTAYEVLFASELRDEQAPTIVIDTKGAVISVRGGCGTAGSIIPKEQTGFILPPKDRK